MAQPTNLQDTTTTIGEREDLSDVIYNISPTETPFMTMAARMKASGILVEWQTDALAAAAANRVLEGDNATIDTAVPTARVGNHCQISRKVVGVSGTLEAVSKAGRKSELAYQLAKRSKELKRDVEFAVSRNQGATTTGTPSTARSLASVESWITQVVKVGADTGSSTTVGHTAVVGLINPPADGSTVATATEALLKSAIALAWAAGGEPDTILVGPYNKRLISSTFSGIATQFRDNPGTKQSTIIAAADVYVSDFGILKVVPSRFNRERVIQVLDMEYWGIAYLRPFQQFELAKTGDSEQREMLAEYTLVAKQQLSSAKLVDVAIA